MSQGSEKPGTPSLQLVSPGAPSRHLTRYLQEAPAQLLHGHSGLTAMHTGTQTNSSVLPQANKTAISCA